MNPSLVSGSGQVATGIGFKRKLHLRVLCSDIIPFMSGAQIPSDHQPSEFPTLDLMFKCHPSKYSTSCTKFAMLTSLLSGCSQEWVAALYNVKSPACIDYAQFVE